MILNIIILSISLMQIAAICNKYIKVKLDCEPKLQHENAAGISRILIIYKHHLRNVYIKLYKKGRLGNNILRRRKTQYSEKQSMPRNMPISMQN
jgi:hypothetical protein